MDPYLVEKSAIVVETWQNAFLYSNERTKERFGLDRKQVNNITNRIKKLIKTAEETDTYIMFTQLPQNVNYRTDILDYGKLSLRRIESPILSKFEKELYGIEQDVKKRPIPYPGLYSNPGIEALLDIGGTETLICAGLDVFNGVTKTVLDSAKKNFTIYLADMILGGSIENQLKARLPEEDRFAVSSSNLDEIVEALKGKKKRNNSLKHNLLIEKSIS